MRESEVFLILIAIGLVWLIVKFYWLRLATVAITYRLPEVLAALGPEVAVVDTGSVCEADERAGNTPLVTFSSYGLSKGLSWQILRHWCLVGVRPFGKFNIPNPFAPLRSRVSAPI